jgi:Restriction endonuclease
VDVGERKKGPDKGIDGVIYFRNGPWGVGQTIVSVKGGENVGVQAVNELAGVVQRDEAQLGIVICFDPTRRMLQDAAGSGTVQTAHGRFQRIQVATVEELLASRHPPMPAGLETEAFRQPLRARRTAVVAPPSAPTDAGATDTREEAKRAGVEDHLSGEVLAAISAG